MRTNHDLQLRLTHFINNYFSDIAIPNTITISFGKKAKRQLGSIKLLPDGTSKITVTSFFIDPSIPQVVVDETIIHEFIHYTHGFSSPLPQYYQHPHKHGIMRKEFLDRGLIDTYSSSKKWLKNNWNAYLVSMGTPIHKKRRVRRKTVKKDPLIFLLHKLHKLLS